MYILCLHHNDHSAVLILVRANHIVCVLTFNFIKIFTNLKKTVENPRINIKDFNPDPLMSPIYSRNAKTILLFVIFGFF